MSQILNLESFPVVTMYFPHFEVARDVTGEDKCANILTTGLEAMFGVHIVTSPFVCPAQITPFYLFAFIHVASPFLVLHSAISLPHVISRYLINPSLVAVHNRK